ncbi:hypothetical protein C8Q77DRAFT_1157738 [Trametes polyzona]|nr:hypothetical protein C8Q77DRAFT_1157738 [Trametes polyzona]
MDPPTAAEQEFSPSPNVHPTLLTETPPRDISLDAKCHVPGAELETLPSSVSIYGQLFGATKTLANKGEPAAFEVSAQAYDIDRQLNEIFVASMRGVILMAYRDGRSILAPLDSDKSQALVIDKTGKVLAQVPPLRENAPTENLELEETSRMRGAT